MMAITTKSSTSVKARDVLEARRGAAWRAQCADRSGMAGANARRTNPSQRSPFRPVWRGACATATGKAPTRDGLSALPGMSYHTSLALSLAGQSSHCVGRSSDFRAERFRPSHRSSRIVADRDPGRVANQADGANTLDNGYLEGTFSLTLGYSGRGRPGFAPEFPVASTHRSTIGRPPTHR